jgi:GGDEF domain-containing protein
MADLSNPEQFDTVLDFAFGIADRGIPLSLVLIEPDGWNRDGATADQVEALETLARDIAERTRRSDRVTRIDQTRFAALLADCNRQGALIFADRLQAAAGNFTAQSGLTVSCGIASYAWGMKTATDLLEAAAAALESAHDQGGDRIELHTPPAPPESKEE